MTSISIVVNGSGGVGKDTFVDMIISELSSMGTASSKFSSVENVKSAMILLGWDSIKDAKSRQLISDLKDLSTELWDGPMKSMELYLKSTASKVVFFMIREPEEINKFVSTFPGSKTLLIKSDRSEIQKFDNHADGGVNMYPYDDIIHNNSTEESLRVAAVKYAADIVEWLRQ